MYVYKHTYIHIFIKYNRCIWFTFPFIPSILFLFIRICNLRQLTKQYYGKQLAISLYASRLANGVPWLNLYHQSYFSKRDKDLNIKCMIRLVLKDRIDINPSSAEIWIFWDNQFIGTPLAVTRPSTAIILFMQYECMLLSHEENCQQ